MKRALAVIAVFSAAPLSLSSCNLIADSEPRLRDGHVDAVDIPAETESEALPDTSADDPLELPDIEEEDGVDPCTIYPMWYLDGDGDGHGKSDVYLCQILQPDSYVELDDDCCDENGDVSPGQTDFFDAPYACPDVESWDYDCDGLIEQEVELYNTFDACSLETDEDDCDAYSFWYRTSPLPCGSRGNLYVCGWDISNGTCDLARIDSDIPQRCR
jgi:hypothetical protein